MLNRHFRGATPLRILGTCALLSLGACGESEPGATADAGPAGGKVATTPDFNAAKEDGRLAPRHLGIIEPGDSETVSIAEGPVSWRARTFPGSRLRIRATSATGDNDPILAVRGPIPATPDGLLAYNDDATADTFDAELVVTADALGAVEVVVGTYGQYQLNQTSPGSVTVTLNCEANCSLPQVPLAVLLDQFGEGPVQSALGDLLPSLFPDAATAAAVQAQVAGYFAGDLNAPFPRVPLAAIGAAQALMESAGPAVPAPTPVTFDLGVLQARDCTVERSLPAPLSPMLPAELTRGGWPDYAREDCAVQRTRSFAEVLNNLALDNGSKVVSGAVEYDSVEDVFLALIEAGHHVIVRNDRYYANFLGLGFAGASVVAPVWVDTGLSLTGGDTLAIPSPHSHHTIIVTGPLVNSELEFYMGTSGGVSFRPIENLKPEWTGERTAHVYDSALDPDGVVDRMALAARLRREWLEQGAGLPLLGYGQLGVCNDSTAVVEFAAEGGVSLYPLAHRGPSGDGGALDQILAELPRDLAGVADANDTWRRVLATLPYTGEPLPQIGAQIQRRQ